MTKDFAGVPDRPASPPEPRQRPSDPDADYDRHVQRKLDAKQGAQENIFAAAQDAQRIEQALGENIMALRVNKWATQHHGFIGSDSFSELMKIIGGGK